MTMTCMIVIGWNVRRGEQLLFRRLSNFQYREDGHDRGAVPREGCILGVGVGRDGFLEV